MHDLRVGRRSLVFRDQVREPQTQPVAGQQLAFGDALAVDERAVARAEVTNDHDPLCKLQSAMPPAEPAVVDSDSYLRATTEVARKLIDHDFARRGQGILAN